MFDIGSTKAFQIDGGFAHYEVQQGVFVIDDLPNGVVLTVHCADPERSAKRHVRITLSVP